MTRVEILEIRREELYDNENWLSSRIELLTARRKNEQKRILEKYIDTYDGYKVNYFDDRVSVYLPESNYSLLDMYVYDEWNGDSRLFNRVEFSTSSFRTEYGKKDMKWATDRFQLLAFYSKALEDFSDDILAEMNAVSEKYDRLVDSFRPYLKDIRKAIRSQNEDIEKLEKENMMQKLFDEDGISFSPEKDDNWLPRFEVKWDYEISSVAGLRATKKSASGKSVDLEVKRRFRDWNSEDWKFDSVKVERVRFDKVESFIKRNQKYIG